jgi:hypothetical protein
VAAVEAEVTGESTPPLDVLSVGKDFEGTDERRKAPVALEPS